MSFFKKMTKEFDDLKATFSGGSEKKEHMHEETRHGETSQHGVKGQQYGQPSYGGGSHYGGAPPPPTNMDSSLPPGWIKQWDSNSQRWYFVEQATGRTQWEPPVLMTQGYGQPNTYPPPGGHYQQPHDSSKQGYGQSNTYPPLGGQYQQPHDSSKKGKGHGTMGAAAGGLAVGAVGGALVGHALGDDSDSDREHGAGHYTTQPSGYSQQPMGYGQQPMQQQPYQAGDPSLQGELPDETRSGSSVSSSDKEDVEEARDEYREALQEGDHSDIEEAREEYEEQYEETYDD